MTRTYNVAAILQIMMTGMLDPAIPIRIAMTKTYNIAAILQIMMTRKLDPAGRF
jgi:hypothetical protein